MSVAPLHEPISLDELLAAYREILHLPDPGIVEVNLASVAANRMTGDPLWLLDVGPPASGKTEIIESLCRLPDTHSVSTFTEAGLLSGSAVREGDDKPTGGLLVELGEQGILMFKDLTTLVSEHASTRNRLFACLREVYDGKFVRSLGTKGGTPFKWEGRAGLIGGVTEVIDTVDLGLLGERFCYYRLPELAEPDTYLASKKALANLGHQRENRKTLARAVERFFANLDLPETPPPLDATTDEWLMILAALGARCRSSVVRGGHDHQLELVPSPERPPRFLVQLGQLYSALTVIGVDRAETCRLVAQIALDGMTRGRRSVLDAFRNVDREHALSSIAGSVRLPPTTTRRHIEDLTAHGVLDLVGVAPDRWILSSWTRDQFEALDLLDLGENL
jgi:hypothetical protein